MGEKFRKLATRASAGMGSYGAFIIAIVLIMSWLVTGPLFDFSDTWQLAINTTTNITIFLMVFLIQYTQNRDARVMQLKLDELLKALHGARTGMIDIEDLPDAELDKISQEFRDLHIKYAQEMEKRRKP